MNIEGGWSYKEACDIITELKQAGFEAGITVGGVWVLAEEGNVEVLKIAKKHGGDSSYGETTAMWMGTENVMAVTTFSPDGSVTEEKHY